MKNGKYYLGYRLRVFSTGALLLACVITGFIAGGCRSSRNMVQETETIEHNEFDTSEQDVSIYGAGNDCIYQRDTVQGSVGERGRIDIERDSTGRPVVIYWAINSNFSAEASTKMLETGIFTLRGSSNSSTNSGSVDSVNQKKEETTTEVKVGIPLESIIGLSIVALLIILYIGDYIYRLWKKRQEK